MKGFLEALKAASVKIGEPKPGTGYLVAPNRVATCHHVVDLWEEGKTYEVEIGYPDPIVCEARIVNSDEKTDYAVLSVEPAVEVAPLPLAKELEVETYWKGFGFPHSADGVGILFKGEILDPKTKDETGRPIIQLYSEQAAAGAATPLVGFSGTPVVVDGAVVGHMIRHVGDPNDRKRPAFGVIYAAPIEGVEALLDVKPSKQAIRPAKLAMASGFVEEMKERGPQEARSLDAPEDKTLLAARILIGQNRPKLALEILGTREHRDLRAKQMLALALAKSDETDKAIELLQGLVDQGANDHETLGLLAGRYKDKWRDTGDKAALWKSYQIYRDTFEQTSDPFNGINVAATALYCGEPTESALFADQVRKVLEGKSEQQLDHWDLATLGEVWLLQNKLDKARDWYQKAVAKQPDLYQDIAVMRRQARINLKHLGKPKNAVDDALPVPGVLAFAGHMLDEPGRDPPRFPEKKVLPVRRAIRSKLEEFGFVQGFGTAAKGSDILFLDEMVQRKVKPIVVMPFPEEDFRRISVGEEWGQYLDAIRDKLEVMVLEPEAPPDDQLPAAFGKSNHAIQKMAMDHAKRLDEKPQLLVVWDGKRQGDGPGGTADVVKLWEFAGCTPTVIDIDSV
jgi:tetratricopeptide (TPR) repeat protein